MFSLKSQGRAEAQGHLNLPFLLPLFLCLSRLFSLPQFFPFLLLLSLFDLLSFFTHSFSHFPFFLLYFLPILSPSTHLYLSMPHLLFLPMQPLSPASLRFSLQAGRGGRKGSSAQGALVGVLFFTSFQIGAGGFAAVSQSPTS